MGSCGIPKCSELWGSAPSVVAWLTPSNTALPHSLSISVYLKSQDYGDVSAGTQHGRLTMS